MSNMNIPVGISDFRRIREENYYYIDKSGLISTLLENTPAQVTLITRPRRFGKTLGMSMLANFFDISQDSRQLFKGLDCGQPARFLACRLFFFVEGRENENKL